MVYASTRQIYGVPRYLPVDERHPIQPVDFNGIHKYAATAYHLLWSDMGRIDARMLCLTNVYGPRLALWLSRPGVSGEFPAPRPAASRPSRSLAMAGNCATRCMWMTRWMRFCWRRAAPAPQSRLWNVGGQQALLAGGHRRRLSAVAGAPPPVCRPFPAEHKGIDIGSYCTDSTRIREEFGWHPRLAFEEGVRRSLEFFQGEFPHYLSEDDAALRRTLATAKTT